jgi:biofilm PGA synthesis N-glycosyltransferase PgaC
MMRSDAYPRYVLITPARNEEKYIEKTLESMARQALPPVRWVIVNDGSADRTREIAARYCEQYPWIELVDLPKRTERCFAGKVRAFNAGLQRVRGLNFEVIGNLDADLSFEADYLEFLMGKFAADPRLGVAGTIFHEDNYNSASDSYEGGTHVAGGCQLFRRECFEAVGGYMPNKAGGIDWIAVTSARMLGWKTRSFQEKFFFHYRSLGTAERGVLASMFSYGEKDYYLGGHPFWELFRVAYRIVKRPYVIGGLATYAGYLWASARRVDRPVSAELIRFHRGEQMAKLKAILKEVFSMRKSEPAERSTAGL